MVTLPELASIKSSIRRKSVVLPAPLFPTSPKLSPCGMVSESMFRTVTSLYIFERFEICIMINMFLGSLNPDLINPLQRRGSKRGLKESVCYYLLFVFTKCIYLCLILLMPVPNLFREGELEGASYALSLKPLLPSGIFVY